LCELVFKLFITYFLTNFFACALRDLVACSQRQAAQRLFQHKMEAAANSPDSSMNSLKNVRVVGSVAAALGVIAALAGSAMSYAPFAFLHGF
jgi:hypothetical protein